MVTLIFPIWQLAKMEFGIVTKLLILQVVARVVETELIVPSLFSFIPERADSRSTSVTSSWSSKLGSNGIISWHFHFLMP